MKRITKNLLVYWQYLGGVLLLFLVQIFSIVSIAKSVQGMRSTGAENSGIEYMVSEAVTSDGWQQVELYMSDLEKSEWNSSYEKGEDGIYYLKDSLKGQQSMADLEETFLVPQAVVWKISQMEEEARNSLMEEYGSPFQIDYMQLRDDIEAKLEALGAKEIQNCAMQFVQEQSKAAGVDMGLMKTQYFSGSIFWILLYLLILAGTVVAVYRLFDTTEAFIRRRILEPEVRRAEQLLMYVGGMMSYGIFLYGFSWYGFSQEQAGAGWTLAGLILLAAGLLGVWLLRTNSHLENTYEKLALTEKNGGRYIRQIRKITVWGIPIAVCAAGILAVFSLKAVYLLFLILADGMIICSAFLIPEIAAAADCVDEIFEEAEEEIY